MNILINKTREIEEKETRTHFGRKKKKIDDLVSIHTYEIGRLLEGSSHPFPWVLPVQAVAKSHVRCDTSGSIKRI